MAFAQPNGLLWQLNVISNHKQISDVTMPGTKLQQRVGNTILQINNDILELLVVYEKVNKANYFQKEERNLKRQLKSNKKLWKKF